MNTLNAKMTRLSEFPIINKTPSQGTHNMYSILVDGAENLGHKGQIV